jgi:hypothetical protein
MFTIQHAGSSGTFRPCGELWNRRAAIAAAKAIREDGYDVRILWADKVDEQATAEANCEAAQFEGPY